MREVQERCARTAASCFKTVLPRRQTPLEMVMLFLFLMQLRAASQQIGGAYIAVALRRAMILTKFGTASFGYKASEAHRRKRQGGKWNGQTIDH